MLKRLASRRHLDTLLLWTHLNILFHLPPVLSFPAFFYCSHSLWLPPICLAALPPSLTLLQQTLRLYFQPSTLTLPPHSPLGPQTSCRHLSCVFSIFSSGIPASFINGEVFVVATSLSGFHIVLLQDIFWKPPPSLVLTPPHSFLSCPFLRSCYPTLCVHFLLLLLSRLLLGCSSSPAWAGWGGAGGERGPTYLCVCVCGCR